MRAPVITLLIFAAAPAFVLYGVVERRAIRKAEAASISLEERRDRRISKFANSWAKEPNYSYSFSALSPDGGAVEGRERAAFDPDDEYWGLPDGEGRDLVSGFCAGCHSMQIVMQQRASEARWAYLLEWMEKEQNMPALSPADHAMTLLYLSENFGPSFFDAAGVE